MKEKKSAQGGSALGGKVAIISDVHNNIVNLKKVLNYCQENDIKTIICCGDLASKETLDFLNDNFDGVIYHTFGNMDDDYLTNYDFGSQYRNTQVYKNCGEADIDGQKIAFVHYPETARHLCQTGNYKFVFFGHTHKPWEENIDQHKILNPGNVAGEIFPPTFAVWDTKNNKIKLIRINDLK
jgi:putative phosphoesterase